MISSSHDDTFGDTVVTIQYAPQYDMLSCGGGNGGGGNGGIFSYAAGGAGGGTTGGDGTPAPRGPGGEGGGQSCPSPLQLQGGHGGSGGECHRWEIAKDDWIVKMEVSFDYFSGVVQRYRFFTFSGEQRSVGYTAGLFVAANYAYDHYKQLTGFLTY